MLLSLAVINNVLLFASTILFFIEFKRPYYWPRVNTLKSMIFRSTICNVLLFGAYLLHYPDAAKILFG